MDTIPAQLLYSTLLRLPDEMIPAITPLPEPDAEFLCGLQLTLLVQTTTPMPVHHHTDPSFYAPGALTMATLVYIRHVTRQLLLLRLYDSPFAVLERGKKFFIVNCNGQPQSVSLD